MARINNLTNFLTDVATAIKTKTEDSSLIPASQFDTKILGIQKGKLSNEEYAKANNNLDDILYQSENVLPDTYQQVEFLESTGTQYIRTDIVPTDFFKMEIKFYTEGSGSFYCAGSRPTVTSPMYFAQVGAATGRKLSASINGTSIVANTNDQDWTRPETGATYEIRISTNGDGTCSYNLKDLTENKEFLSENNEYTIMGTVTYNMYLFALNPSNKILGTNRCYYFKLYEENELIFYGIPCYRKSDNKPGMYDTVNNVFYTNEGTGEFAVGADVDVLNTKIESILTEKNAKILSANIKNGINILGITGTYEGSSGFPPDWSQIGYEDTPQSIIDEFNTAKQIYDNWDNTTTSMLDMFKNRKDIFLFPPIDTSNVTNMNSTFYASTISVLPVLDTGNVTGLYNTFKSCGSLTSDSLNNIMQMCINATNYTSTKTLYNMGISQAQATTCQSLSNYQAFLNAGWSTGY